MEIIRNRYAMAMTTMHYAAFLLSSSLKNVNVEITENEKQIAADYIEENFSDEFLSLLFKLIAGIKPFFSSIMNINVVVPCRITPGGSSLSHLIMTFDWKAIF